MKRPNRIDPIQLRHELEKHLSNEWKIFIYNVTDKNDSLWYVSDTTLISIGTEKSDREIRIEVTGDVYIYDPEKPCSLVYESRYGWKKGEMSDGLIEKGEIKNNNWFQLYDSSGHYDEGALISEDLEELIPKLYLYTKNEY